MKSKKRWYILIELLLAIVVAWFIFLMFQGRSVKEVPRISVIVQNSEDEQWAAFKYGLEMAAEEEGVKISYVSTGSNLGINDVLKIIDNEKQNHTNGFIFQPAENAEDNDKMNAVCSGYPTVCVETDRLDNYGMGKAAASEIVKDYPEGLNGKKVGIVKDASDAEADAKREKGLLDGLADTGADICWSITEDMLQSNIGVQTKTDIIVSLDDLSTRSAGEYLTSNPSYNAKLYGIAYSIKSVYYLDSGAAVCLAVPDEFSVGYYSLKEAAQKYNGMDYEDPQDPFSFSVLRKDNLFSKENEKLLFTLNQ